MFESGNRIYITNFTHDKKTIPSQFTIKVLLIKLRKFIRGKKLVSISQCGLDRVINMTFASQEEEFHLIIEFYAAGNVILTDNKYTIITLLRVHAFDEETKCAPKFPYPFSHSANMKFDPFSLTINESLILKAKLEIEEESKNKKGKIKAKNKNREIICRILPFISNSMADCAFLSAINQYNGKDEKELLIKAANIALEMAKKCLSGKCKGYVYTRPKTNKEQGNKEASINVEEDKNYKEDKKEEELLGVEAFLMENKEIKFKEFETFNAALDAYFTEFEKQKEIESKVQKENAIIKKMTKIKEDQESRITLLKTEQEENIEKAQLIENNIEKIETVINIIRTMSDSGMTWKEISKNVKEEKKKGNPFAQLIVAMDLENRNFSVAFNQEIEESNEDNEKEIRTIKINFDLTAFQNAQFYYQSKKKLAIKQKKTEEAAEIVIKKAEAQVEKALSAEATKAEKVLKVRHTFWFEKFHWFITSENYLVISGRNAQENELLVKRHLKSGDLYIHADVQGAASCIFKNHSPSKGISPISIEEAGKYCICRSRAWEVNNYIGKSCNRGLLGS